MSEFDFETKSGLPERMPDGERLLWQGSPDWASLTRRVLHGNLAAIYIAVVAVWGAQAAYLAGDGAGAVASSAGRVLLAGALGLGLLALIGRMIVRTTVYSITTERIVMRVGVALPITVTIPLGLVKSADLKLYSDGTGDIPIATMGDTRLGFVPLWPHVRAWRINRPQPTLRCVANAKNVAAQLANVLATTHGTVAKPIAVEDAPGKPGDLYGTPAAA